MNFPLLEKTSLWPVLSGFGKEIVSPQGIFYWAGRAKQEAEVNATIGTALEDDGTNCYMSFLGTLLDEKFFKKVKGSVFDYAPMPGLPTLRQKWKAQMMADHGDLAAYASLPIVTNGITQGISIVGLLFLEPGETLLTPEKYWSNYNLILPAMQKVKIAPTPFFFADGALDTEGIRASMEASAISQGKVVLLLNFPHNQTGFTPDDGQADALVKVIHETVAKMPDVPFVIVLDDAYEGYVYDDNGIKKSLFGKLFMKGRKNFSMIKMDGASKNMLAYGLRIGFITVFGNKIDGMGFTDDEQKLFTDEVTSKVAGVIRGTISNCSRLGQTMIEAVLDDPVVWKEQVAKTISLLRRRAATMVREINVYYEKFGKEKLWIDPFNSGFFCFVNLHASIDPKALTEKLLKDYKIGVVPNTVKDDNGKVLWNGIRVAFCGVPEANIKRLVNGIFDAVYS